MPQKRKEALKPQFLDKAAYITLLLVERDGKIVCDDSKITEEDLNATIKILGGKERVLGILRKNYVALLHDDLRIMTCHARNGKCQGCVFHGECYCEMTGMEHLRMILYIRDRVKTFGWERRIGLKGR